jgi:hypothetical protein
MKIFRMLRDHYVGSRLFCEGVQYSLDDDEAALLIANGHAVLEEVAELHPKTQTEE